MPQPKRHKRRKQAGRKAKPQVTVETVVRIVELGDGGDGVALVGEDKVFVPGTLPGESARIALSGKRGEVLELLEPAPTRHAARCPHDAECGGCALQHLGAEAEEAFKQQLLTSALAREGLTAKSMNPMITVPERSRRRASFALWRENKKPAFGFQGQKSHEQVAIRDCAVVDPNILEAMPGIVEALDPIIKRHQDTKLQVTSFSGGLDLNLVGARLDPLDLEFEEMNSLSAVVALPEVLRLSLDGVLYLEPKAPTVCFGGVTVLPPPGAFLQATETSEHALQELVVKALMSRQVRGRVADLFCGCGTFTLPIAEHLEVVGFDAEEAQITALQTAIQRAAQNHASAERRDLYQRPLVELELKKFDALVLDPPRAGARDQAERIAASNLDLVVYVSCDRKSFARDGRILQEGGFTLTELTPVDQFKYAAHLECVGVFERN